MLPYEEKTAEQIWQAIDVLKRAPHDTAGPGVLPELMPDTDQDELVALAASLSTVFHEESQASSGQTSARLRLQAAIQSDFAVRPAPVPSGRGIRPRFAWSRTTALLMLLLLLAVTAIATGLHARSVYLADQVQDNAIMPSPLHCPSKALPASPAPNKALTPTPKGSGPALKSLSTPPKCD